VSRDEHDNPGEATVLVLPGRVEPIAGTDRWEGRDGDLLVIPDTRHTLHGLGVSTVLLTAVARAYSTLSAASHKSGLHVQQDAYSSPWYGSRNTYKLLRARKSIRYCDAYSGGGQAMSGLPISHSWPNGSMSLPTRQPCSSSTGDLP
jgi:hypothetical protein